MPRTKTVNVQALSTFELAFKLAAGDLTEKHRLAILNVINEREITKRSAEYRDSKKTRRVGKRLPGSKAAKIEALLKKGISPAEVASILKQKNITVYPAEIYRI